MIIEYCSNFLKFFENSWIWEFKGKIFLRQDIELQLLKHLFTLSMMDVDGLSTGSGFCMADTEARECRGDTKTPKVWSLTVYELAVLICSLPSIEIDK